MTGDRMIKFIKYFFRNYIIPIKLYSFLGRSKIFFSKKNKYINQFPHNWRGQKFKPKFKNETIIESENSYIKTVNYESKFVYEIKLNKKILIKKLNKNDNLLTFSIFKSKDYEEPKNIKVFINDKKVKEIFESLTPDKWLYFDLDITNIDSNINLEIKADGANTLLISEPLFKLKSKNENKNKKANVIVMVLDGLKPDLIGLYNQKKKNNTPYIDQFFQDGLIFKKAFSQSEYTMPSLASMFSGLYPIQHGVFTHDKSQRELPTSVELITEKMSANNYRTMVYSNGLRFIPQYGFYRGVEKFFHHNFSNLLQDSFSITNRAIEFAETHKDENFFMFLHYIDTHPPFSIPTYFYDVNSNSDYFHDSSKIYNKLKLSQFKDQNLIKRVEQTADIKLKNLDYIIGTLFGFLRNSGLDKNTSVILLADHGRKYEKSSPLLTKDLTQVPLLIKYPNSKFESKDFYCETNTSLYPTIMDLTKIEKPQHLSGRSVFESNQNSYALTESLFRRTAETSIRENDYVYIQKTDFDYMNGDVNLDNISKEYLFLENDQNDNGNYTDLSLKELEIKNKLKGKIKNHYVNSTKYFDNDHILNFTKNYKE